VVQWGSGRRSPHGGFPSIWDAKRRNACD